MRRDAAAISIAATRVVKMKIGGEPIAEDRRRIEAVLKEIGARPAGGGRQRTLRSGDGDRLCENAAGIRLFWYEEAGDPLDYQFQAALAEFYPGPDGDGGEPVQPPGCAQPDPLRRHAARIATGCSSIALCHTGCANTSGRWRC